MKPLGSLLLWLTLAMLFPQPYSDGVHVLDDLLARWSQGQVSGASADVSVRTVSSGGVAMRAGFLQPSTRLARNVFVVDLPAVNSGDLLILTAWAGVDDNARRDDPQNPHDGVRARILVENQVAAEAECDTSGWRALSVDLTPHAGKTVTVIFEMDAKRHAAYDWAYFAQPQVARLRERFALKVGRNLPPEGVLEVRGAAGDRFTLSAPNYPTLRAEIPTSGVIWLRYAFSGARGATLSETQPQTAVRIYPLQPRLRLESVSSVRAVLTSGETTEIVARIRNIGAGTWQNDRIQITAQPLSDVEVLSRPEPNAELLPPDGVYEARFRVRVGARPRLSVMLRSGAGNDATILLPVVVAPLPNLPSGGALARAENGYGILQNERLRLVIAPASSGAHAARLFMKQGGEWVPIAASAPVAEAIVNAEGAPPKLSMLTIESITADPETMRLTLQGRVGLTARASIEYRLEGSALHCISRLTAEVNAHLYRFRCPDWRVGDGSFGAAKDEALFPGLEYLIGSEASFKAIHATPPFDLRFAPHPYKITAPVMAVRWRHLLVSLEWDPSQSWSGVLRAPNALFASPNFLESGANHRLALWVPSIPRWADENTEQAREPFRLLRGESVILQATLRVRTDATDVIEAMAHYLAQVGAPYPPAPQRNDFAAMQLTVQGLLNSYDGARRAWRQAHTGDASYDPQAALPLWVLAHRLFPEDLRRRQALEQVRAAVDAQPIGRHGVDLAFYVGGLPRALEAFQQEVEPIIKAQREDGGGAGQPSTSRHALLGTAGERSSGWTGMHAVQVGRFSQMTLQPAACESLLRSMRYLSQQRRPEGAQTEPMPMHAPELLASAHALNACLDAHTLTGDAEYLQQAVRWALRGTPLIYLWHTPDKPIMRGASLPAFGAPRLSQQIRAGVAVQWNGLVYARALYRLARHSHATDAPAPIDWKRLADAITLCAVQQQEWVSDRRADREGFYPDAFDIPSNREAYPSDLNPRLIAPCIAERLGFTIEPQTRIVRWGERVIACTAPGLQMAGVEAGILRLQVTPPATDLPAIYVLIAGIYDPVAVRLNGVNLPRVNDMDALIWHIPNAQSGWMTCTFGTLVRIVQPTAIQLELEK
ncbi:MAG: hypothetical protein KatS3mg019_1984 [Fimbriimonadales bacterium]|nr:MAG: hypothetical protein KatS3mg019_1984 [Fimbriimonadales bacterium]